MNTNNLITDLIAAMIPVAQKYVDQQTENNKPGTQLSIVKQDPANLMDMTYSRISRYGKKDMNLMKKIVETKIKNPKKKQIEIAEDCNTYQTKVSKYLNLFKLTLNEIKSERKQMAA